MTYTPCVAVIVASGQRITPSWQLVVVAAEQNFDRRQGTSSKLLQRQKSGSLTVAYYTRITKEERRIRDLTVLKESSQTIDLVKNLNLSSTHHNRVSAFDSQ